MTSNGTLALTLRYFTKLIGKPAFQLMTASSSIKLIDQKSASITHRAVKLVCVTKFTHSRWSEFRRYLLLIYGVSYALHCCLVVMPSFRFTVNTVMCESIVLRSTCTMSS